MGFFQPDRFFSRVSAIDVEWDLVRKGFSHVILDVDNTILTRDDHTVPSDVAAWLGRLRGAGIGICLLSNNFHEGVLHLADRLGLPIVARAVKPLPHGFALALRKLGGTRSDTVVIGDQLITDVIGAHISGMQAYLVLPLVEADLKHTLLLRNVERVLLAGRVPEDDGGEVVLPGLAPDYASDVHLASDYASDKKLHKDV